MRKKLLYTLGASLICLLGIASVSMAIFPEQTSGAFSKYGLPGIYNSTDFTLDDGQGSAIAVDSSGAVMISPSSSLSTLTVDTLTATSATIGTLNVSLAGSALEQLEIYNAGRTATTSIGTVSSSFSGDLYVSKIKTASGDLIFEPVSYIRNINPTTFSQRAIMYRDTYLSNENAETSIIHANSINKNVVWAVGTQYNQQLILAPLNFSVGGSSSLNKNFDHADLGTPVFYVHNSTNPDYSNNIWGGMYHDGDNFILSTGVETGAGTNPLTIDNDIIIAPRGITSTIFKSDGTIVHNDLIKNESSESVADDGTITLATGVFGMLEVWTDAEYMKVYVLADGTITSVYGSTNTAIADTDANLCVYDDGTGAVIKNRLGAIKTVKYIYNY